MITVYWINESSNGPEKKIIEKINAKLCDQIGLQMGSAQYDGIVKKNSWKRSKLRWDLRRVKVQYGRGHWRLKATLVHLYIHTLQYECLAHK